MGANKELGEELKGLLKGRRIKQKEASLRLGIKPPSLSQMLNGVIPLPKDKFLKLVSMCEPEGAELERLKSLYFGDMAYVLLPPPSPSPASISAANEVRPMPTMIPVPVISFAQAAGYEPALEPMDDYAKGCSEETAMFSYEIRPGYFALYVDGDSMAPDFPHGTVILVAGGEFPQRGDIVVAKLRDGQVVVKRYYRKNNLIKLESINPSGKNFEWHCKDDPGFIQWMYPVLEATIDLRKRRWEQSRMIYKGEQGEELYQVAEDKRDYAKNED